MKFYIDTKDGSYVRFNLIDNMYQLMVALSLNILSNFFEN